MLNMMKWNSNTRLTVFGRTLMSLALLEEDGKTMWIAQFKRFLFPFIPLRSRAKVIMDEIRSYMHTARSSAWRINPTTEFLELMFKDSAHNVDFISIPLKLLSITKSAFPEGM